jgi:hypothetical protein
MPDGFIAACAGKRQSAILHVRGAYVFRINLSILPAWPYTTTPHGKCLMSRQGESRHIQQPWPFAGTVGPYQRNGILGSSFSEDC